MATSYIIGKHAFIFAPIMKFILAIFLLTIFNFQSNAGPYNVFEENGKVGLKDQRGEIVIPAAYESLGWSEGEFSVMGDVTGYKLDGLWGLINLSNQRVTPAEYVSLRKGNNSMIIASKQSPLTFRTTTGCLNQSGKTVIPFEYTGLSLTDHRAIVFVRDDKVFKYGVIDLNNKSIIPKKYRSIAPLGTLRFAVEDFDGKYAIYTEEGKSITPFEIDSISPFRNSLAVFIQNGLSGIINREGKIVHEPIYRQIEIGPTVRGRKLDQWSVLSCDNKLAKSFDADSIVQLEHDRFKLVKASISQLTDENFEKIGNGHHQLISSFTEGMAVVGDGDKLGVIDINNNIKLPSRFDEVILSGKYVFAATRSGGKMLWGIYDREGTRLTSKNYDAINPFNGEFFPVRKNGFWGGVDKYGVEILACVYDEILECKFERAVVKFKGLYGIITLKEDWLVTPRKNKLKLISDARYFEESDDLLFLKAYNNFVYYFTTNPVQVTEEGLVEQTTIGAVWTINFDGQIIKREEAYDEPLEQMFPSSEGLRGIKKNGRYGFIDDRGRLRIANRYEGIKPFSEGFAAIKILGKWGFIDHDEKIAVQPNYDDVTPFEQGYSIVRQGNLFGLINKSGQLILPARYDEIKVLESGKLLATHHGLKGLANEKGILLIQCKYTDIQDLNNNYAIVTLNDKMGVVNLNGISTIPLMYDYMYFDTHQDRIIAIKKTDWTELH